MSLSGSSSGLHADPAARHEAELAVGDHGFTRREPVLDDGLGAARPGDGDRPQVHRLIRLDDVDELTLRAGLNGDRRNHDRRRIGRQRHDDVDELARPEPAIVVGKRALDPDGAGRLVHRVVDERNSAVRRRTGVVGCTRLDTQRSLRQVALEIRQLRFRDAERNVDGRDLVDDDERRGVVGADQVAVVDDERAGSSGDGRRDRRVFELHLGVLDGGAIGADRRVERGGRRRAGLDLLARDEAALSECLVSLRLSFRVRRLREIALEVRLRPAGASPPADADPA